MMMWPTPWARAKSSSAATGSPERRRTTSAPSSFAFSMFDSRWRWASASMRCGASRGVSTYTTNQSVLSRPAMREPRRSSVAACGGWLDRATSTRPQAPPFWEGSSPARACRPAVARSRLSATSRSASSRRVERLSPVKKRSSACDTLSGA